MAWAADGFRDPAPPTVLTPAAVEPPAARPNPEAQFHRKPKALARDAVTSDWTNFLGPTFNATSPETRLLKKWPAGGPALVWEMKKGTGYSSPAIMGNRLFYFHRGADQERVLCLQADTGALYWEFAYGTQFEDRYGYNNGPRASPVTDGDRVYTLGAEGKLHCLRAATGQLLWKRDLAREFKVRQDFFGTAGTPLIEGDLLILNVGAPGGPSAAAFHKLNGRLVWGAGTEWGPSYASPVPATIRGKRMIFVFAGGESEPPTGGLLGMSARDGALSISFPWRSRSYESVNASNPVVIGNAVFVSASYKTGGALIEAQEDGKQKVLWTSKEIGTHFNTAVHKDGYLYAFDGRNEPDASLVCVDVKTGQTAWRQTLEWEETFTTPQGERKQLLSPYRGSLLAVDGKFLCLGELGHLLWLDLTPKGCTVMARHWLFAARESWSLPVVSKGLLYVSQHSRDVVNRTTPRLVCYDLREG